LSSIVGHDAGVNTGGFHLIKYGDGTLGVSGGGLGEFTDLIVVVHSLLDAGEHGFEDTRTIAGFHKTGVLKLFLATNGEDSKCH